MVSADIRIVVVDSPTAEAHRLWSLTLDLAEAFGVDTDWALVGGLMVQAERASARR
jgi:hypothetical protein